MLLPGSCWSGQACSAARLSCQHAWFPHASLAHKVSSIHDGSFKTAEVLSANTTLENLRHCTASATCTVKCMT